MHRSPFLIFSTLLIVIAFSSCGLTNNNTTHCPCIERELTPNGIWQGGESTQSDFVGLEEVSFDNYPIVDGSTSAKVLNMMIACKLLNVRYCWYGAGGGIEEWGVSPSQEDTPEEYKDFWGEHVRTSQTHGAFMNLIDGVADIILTHRTISPDEKAHANEVGVSLIETSVALDAFVFVINKKNHVKSVTVNQVQKMYMGEITNWKQVGGKNVAIDIYSRPRNSGSEEVFRELVMDGLEPADFPPYMIINPMWEVLAIAMDKENSICYTFNNYKDIMARRPCDVVPVLAINGICPSEHSVKNKTYPFVSEVRVAIRSDLDTTSIAYKLYEWLQSDNAKSTIEECGFFTSGYL